MYFILYYITVYYMYVYNLLCSLVNPPPPPSLLWMFTVRSIILICVEWVSIPRSRQLTLSPFERNNPKRWWRHITWYLCNTTSPRYWCSFVFVLFCAALKKKNRLLSSSRGGVWRSWSGEPSSRRDCHQTTRETTSLWRCRHRHMTATADTTAPCRMLE